MAGRARSILPKRWRDALRPDADLALAEGLAAGTGLLTGTIARSRVAPSVATDPCPQCEATDPELLVVDLVGERTTLRCRSCGHRWETDVLPASGARRPTR